MRELDSRRTDGLHVRLLWCQGEGRVYVAVADNKTGETFSVKVPHDKRALHVFEHPFGYAA